VNILNIPAISIGVPLFPLARAGDFQQAGDTTATVPADNASMGKPGGLDKMGGKHHSLQDRFHALEKPGVFCRRWLGTCGQSKVPVSTISVNHGIAALSVFRALWKARKLEQS
jgi:hypothetical protein